MYFLSSFSMTIADTHRNSQVLPNELNESLLNAVQHNDVQAVMAALAAGAAANAVDGEGVPALMLATFKGHSDCVKQLLAAKAEVDAEDADKWSSLMVAANNGDATCVKLLLAAGANVNKVDFEGESSLMRAVRYGHAACVSLLLAAGADIHSLGLLDDEVDDEV